MNNRPPAIGRARENDGIPKQSKGSVITKSVSNKAGSGQVHNITMSNAEQLILMGAAEVGLRRLLLIPQLAVAAQSAGRRGRKAAHWGW
jgi:hypothetical protein